MTDLKEFRDTYTVMLNKVVKWIIFAFIGLGALQFGFSYIWHIQGMFKDAPAMVILMIACVLLGNLICLQYINKKLDCARRESR